MAGFFPFPTQHWLYRQRLRVGRLLWVFWLVVFWLVVSPPVALAAPASQASQPEATLFETHCAGCHANGGNIIRRGKTLKPKALQRNGYDTPTAIAQIITQGKGAMTAFGDRLSPTEIDAIAQYVLTQAETGW